MEAGERSLVLAVSAFSFLVVAVSNDILAIKHTINTITTELSLKLINTTPLVGRIGIKAKNFR
jgi:hypothetical protein